MLKHMPTGPPSGQQRGPIRGGLNRSIQPLNVSTISGHQSQITPNKILANGHANGAGPNLILPPPRMSTNILNTTPLTSCSSHYGHFDANFKHSIGAREALTSLGLLCLGECPFESDC